MIVHRGAGALCYDAAIRGEKMREQKSKRNHFIWLGPVLTFVGGLSYFMFFARFPTLRDFPWINLPLVLAGLALSAFGVWRAFARPGILGKLLGSVGLLISLGLATLFGWYVFGLSYGLPQPTQASLTLQQAPAFTLTDHDGSPVRLEDLRGRKVVLTFYRGHW